MFQCGFSFQEESLKRPPIRLLDIAGSPAAMGHAHGRAHADEIRAYTDERVRLVMAGTWSGGPVERGTVLDLAAACLPAHETFSPALHEEMVAMADAARITPAEAIVVGGFTDFVDTVRANLGGTHPPSVVEDDCTAFIVPDDRAGGAGFFGQTWDMHDSATDHVMLLRTRPVDAPATLVFTTTGCLGQIGMNELGVCVGINNLTATDGGLGVTWPSVVREALHQESAAAARDIILAADLAGGHNFMTFDARGEGYNIEAMPTARPVTALGDEALSHTNHTTTPETRAVEGERPPALQTSSHHRLDTATRGLDRDDITVDDLITLTGGDICQVSTAPVHIESSGAAIMRPRTLEFWACWGPPADNDYRPVEFATATA
jgi:isopenicillin-N N-acyltransferase like protein